MTIKIIAATLTTKELEMITDSGDSITLPQGHPKIPMLIEKILPVVATGKIAVIEPEDIKTHTVYEDFEKKTGGLVKFFRMAKNKVSTLFGHNEEVFVDLGEKEKSIQEIMDGATQELQQDETIVSQIGGNFIPGMEKLSSHFHHSLTKMGSTQGIVRFLERVGAVIKDKQHSIEDLLTFMEKADLPIADDGSIIIYKGLNHYREVANNHLYVDSHSGTVIQKVGTLVHMKPTSVDGDRSKDCSFGLHVARKGYLSHFRTDIVTLCKVNPEDVIAVPKYDPSKMRVCAYHILFVLPAEDAAAVRASRPMKAGSIGSKMLAAAISGNHTGITSKTFIGGPRGTELTLEGFSELETEATPMEYVPVDVECENVVEQVSEIDDSIPKSDPVDVLASANKIKEIKNMTRSEEIRMLVKQHKTETYSRTRKDILQNILDLKRASKKSWEYHGVSEKDAKRITEFAKTL